MTSRFVFILSFLLAVCCAAAVQAKSPLETFQNAYQDRQAKFRGDIEKLAVHCEEHELAEAAENLRALLASPEWTALHLEALPKVVQPEIPSGLSDEERYWRVQLRRHQTDYAKQLYSLAQQVQKAGFPGFAFDLVRETAIHDPDHTQARRLLGFVQHRDEWVTLHAAKLLKDGNVWTEEFGWLKRAHVERYNNGERLVGIKWVSKEKEAEICRDFQQAWIIRTDHFEIKTNHSREQGLELGRALEDFHEMFFQTFAGFFNAPEQLGRLFSGTSSNAKTLAAPYHVSYFRTRDEYIKKLKSQVPQIEVTNGLYLTSDRVAYFYHDPNADNQATLFHEATHQLFYEWHPKARAIAEKDHFWIIEGIACYMESFRRDVHGMSLGDPAYVRFADARHNLLRENYYIPLREFAGRGMREFQHDPQLPKSYSQASGLAHFFMHSEDGRYREALVAHLSQLYSVKDQQRQEAQGLDELTGVPAAELDQAYAEYCRETERQLEK